MDQPIQESMTADQAASSIESLLGVNEPDAGPEPEEVEEAPETEIKDESDESEQEETEETDDESEETSEEAEPEEETEEPQIESLADLAEALEIPIEELQANLKTKIKVDGEEMEVTLKELTQGYQKDADYRQKTSELADRRRTFEQQEQAVAQKLNQDIQFLGQLAQHIERFAVPAPDPAEMEHLKQTDPNRYLIKKSEYDEKRGYFSQLQQQLSQAQQQQANQLAQYQEAQRAEAFRKAREELPVRVPDWSPAVKTELDNYLTSDKFGYTPEELAQIVDPRLVEIVHKAYLYDTKATKVDATKEKVKTLPKVQKPSKPAALKPKVSGLQKAKTRLAKTGSLDDAASAIANML